MLGRFYYIFTGLHSLLIGLFPFYVPVYLYTNGLNLSSICLFIAATGMGYSITLFLWDRLCRRVPFPLLILWSFVSEYLFLSLFFFEQHILFVLFAGLVNGMFNCTFWTIQRLLFTSATSSQNSGKNFGNYQLFVLAVLKIGLLLGGFILEKEGFLTVYLFSGGVVLLSAAFFWGRSTGLTNQTNIQWLPPVTVPSILTFKDDLRSRTVFALDGVFLYLESYFWVISLFFIVRESFLRLGLLVVIFAVIFGLLFLTIKNNIDRLPTQKVYTVSVVLYALSWALRGFLGENHDPAIILPVLAFITFATSVFRLSFNKRFFDNTKASGAYTYIFIKSYFSQFVLALCFAAIAAFFDDSRSAVNQLSALYYLAALSSFSYLVYKARHTISRVC